MSPRKKAKVAFASAMALLFLSGLAGFLTIRRLLESQSWVIHSYEVRSALGDFDSAILQAGRARSSFLIFQTDEFVADFETAAPGIARSIQYLRDLTRDNPTQQELCTRLDDLSARRLALFRQSIQLKQQAPHDDQGQTNLQRQNLAIAREVNSVLEQMRENEEHLLNIREETSYRLLVLTAAVLSCAFLLALTLLYVHSRFLFAELTAREQAEKVARESEDALRRVTGRLLQLQDEERRKFSRELHDSLGQYLAGVKMNLVLFESQRTDALLTEAIQLLDQSITETRTISHLLHPPLLDEAGFSSAAKWYLDGFAQRSGIAVQIDLPDDVRDLPKPVALGLFRILQESLTNIHRHAASAKADVVLALSPDHVVLKVRDYGKGISPRLLRLFTSQGTNSGVGLAGMRERVRELGGQLSIQPCTPGTLISANIPLSLGRFDPPVAGGDA